MRTHTLTTYPKSRRLRVGDIVSMYMSARKHVASIRAEVTVLSVADNFHGQDVVASGKHVGSMRFFWNPAMSIGTGDRLVFSFVRPGTPAGWLPMSEAPRNATVVKVIDESGHHFNAHWAEDLSGECQPPFRGWFRATCTNGGYYGIPEPVGWLPIAPAG